MKYSILVTDVCVHVFLETFQMGKIHKDIAMFMVDAVKNEEHNDQNLVKVIRQLDKKKLIPHSHQRNMPS